MLLQKTILLILFYALNSYLFAQFETNSTIKFSDTLASDANPPIFVASGADVESDLNEQDASALLQASKDVFAQFAGFQFGSAHYRIRGYLAENTQVTMNGSNMENLESGTTPWRLWSGLNDATRLNESRIGIFPSRYGFSGLGGYSHIDAKASSFKKGTRFSYANANSIFRHRLMLSYSTGLSKNGWACSFSLCKRYGDEVYVPGTYFNSNAYFVSIEKHFKNKHQFNLTCFYSPIEQGRSSAEPLEVYQLSNNHYYNSLWGYQNGKVRNASVSRSQQPVFIFSHTYQFSKNSSLTNALNYTGGKNGLSALNWNNANNPRPDYYRYLPSYYYNKGDSITGNLLTNNWGEPINQPQINWDKLIAMNQSNLYVLPSQIGQTINNTETRARYIVENKVEDLQNINFNSVYNSRIKKTFISIGLNANVYRNRKYKVMEDLLGATYWLDYDQFAQNLGIDTNIQQNDISKPDHKIFKGNQFGYDYRININRAEIWSQVEHNFKKTETYLASSFSHTEIWREGLIANGKFPNTSKGQSQHLNFNNYGFKVGFAYKFNGRHAISFNSIYLNRHPDLNKVFISPTVRNDCLNGIQNEEVFSADINYLVKYSNFKFRFTGYSAQFNHQIALRNYWHDEYNTNVNLIMKHIDQNNSGVELGIEKNIYTSHVLQAAIGVGRFVYTNRPIIEAWQDNNANALFENREVYLKNFRVGGSPQLVAGFAYKYTAKKNWNLGFNINYIDEIYVEPNPDRRTKEALSKYLENEEEVYNKIIQQEKLPAYYLVNLNFGKSLLIAKRCFLNFNLRVNNVLNNKNILIGGFEQMRWDQGNIEKFANKYVYMQGLNYMVRINLTY